MMITSTTLMMMPMTPPMKSMSVAREGAFPVCSDRASSRLCSSLCSSEYADCHSTPVNHDHDEDEDDDHEDDDHEDGDHEDGDHDDDHIYHSAKVMIKSDILIFLLMMPKTVMMLIHQFKTCCNKCVYSSGKKLSSLGRNIFQTLQSDGCDNRP